MARKAKGEAGTMTEKEKLAATLKTAFAAFLKNPSASNFIASDRAMRAYQNCVKNAYLAAFEMPPAPVKEAA